MWIRERLSSLCVGFLAVILLLPSVAPAGEDVLEFLYAENFDAVLAIAAAELDSDSVDLSRKLEILRATAVVHILRHQTSGDAQEESSARIAMQTMLRLDPDTDFVPGHCYPRGAHALFGQVRNEVQAEAPRAQSPTRVAVAPFYPYDYEMNLAFDSQAFAAALPFMVASDLEAIQGLTLLSREHMDVVQAELDLASEAQLVSAENRVRLGRLLSASAFVYGSVQVTGDEVTLTIRWVPTETGVVETAWRDEVRVRDGRDLLELYHSVVTEQFIPRMLEDLKEYVQLEKAEQERQERRRRDFAKQGDRYLGYIASVARAIRAEEAGNLVQAAEHWKTASAQVEADASAGQRAQLLELVVAFEPVGEPE